MSDMEKTSSFQKNEKVENKQGRLKNLKMFKKGLQKQIMSTGHKQLENLLSDFMAKESNLMTNDIIEEDNNNKADEVMANISKLENNFKKRHSIMLAGVGRGKSLIKSGKTGQNADVSPKSALKRFPTVSMKSILKDNRRKSESYEDEKSDSKHFMIRTSKIYDQDEKIMEEDDDIDGDLVMPSNKKSNKSLLNISDNNKSNRKISINLQNIAEEEGNSTNRFLNSGERSSARANIIKRQNNLQSGMANVRQDLKQIMNIELKDKNEEEEDEDFFSYEEDEEAEDSDEEFRRRQLIREKFRKVIKLKKVYDSFSDSEGEEELDDEMLIIHPNSPFRKYFELLILIVTCYSLIYTPLILINISLTNNSLINLIVEIVVDFVYMLDIILSFITGYLDMEENIVCVKKLIIREYLKTWFIPDSLVSFPANTILMFYLYMGHYNLESPSLILMLVLVRGLKVFKAMWHNKTLINLSQLFTISEKSRFYYSIVVFFVITHILACIFMFLGQLGYPSWTIKYQIIDTDFIERYVSSIYFNLATIYTIGYGDITSVNIYERVYNVLLLMIGIMVYSYAVSSLSNYVQDSDVRTRKLENSVSYLDQLKMKYHIKDSIYNSLTVLFIRYNYLN